MRAATSRSREDQSDNVRRTLEPRQNVATRIVCLPETAATTCVVPQAHQFQTDSQYLRSSDPLPRIRRYIGIRGNVTCPWRVGVGQLGIEGERKKPADRCGPRALMAAIAGLS